MRNNNDSPSSSIDDNGMLWAAADRLGQGDAQACDRLLHAIGAPAPALHWAPPQDQVCHGKLDVVYRWWEGARGDSPAPGSDRLSPLAFPEALGHIAVLAPTDKGEDFHIRLYGSALAEKTKHDVTGQSLSEIWTPLRYYFLVLYRALMVRREPLLSWHTPPHDINIHGWIQLALPLIDDGAVTRIVTTFATTHRQDRPTDL